MPDEKEILTPPDRQITAKVELEALVNVIKGYQILFIRTPWGWIYQRDDGTPFLTLPEAIKRPAPPAPVEPEPVETAPKQKLTDEPPQHA